MQMPDAAENQTESDMHHAQVSRLIICLFKHFHNNRRCSFYLDWTMDWCHWSGGRWSQWTEFAVDFGPWNSKRFSWTLEKNL